MHEIKRLLAEITSQFSVYILWIISNDNIRYCSRMCYAKMRNVLPKISWIWHNSLLCTIMAHSRRELVELLQRCNDASSIMFIIGLLSRCKIFRVERFMGPTWGRQDPVGPHVGPMNVAIWVAIYENMHHPPQWMSGMFDTYTLHNTSHYRSYLSSRLREWQLILLSSLCLIGSVCVMW